MPSRTLPLRRRQTTAGPYVQSRSSGSVIEHERKNAPMKSFFLIFAAFAAYISGAGWEVRSQASASVSATVEFSDGETATVTDFSNSVGVQPNEYVKITLQFPVDFAGQPVTAKPIDGGNTSIGSSILVAGTDGSITFSFLAANHPGGNSVVIQVGATSVCLQLWVMDSANPENNPSTLIAVSHG